MGQIDVVLRVGSASQVANLQTLCNRLGVTATVVSPAFSCTVAAVDEDRQDAILQMLRNDPIVALVGQPN